MAFKQLDVVVLTRDLPGTGLEAGDLGTVVQVYGADTMEVEFVTAAGQTVALMTLDTTQIRPVGGDDLVAVRTRTRPA